MELERRHQDAAHYCCRCLLETLQSQPDAPPRACGVQPPARTEVEGEDPLDRPALPLAMAVALACIVLFVWAIAPCGWRGR